MKKRIALMLSAIFLALTSCETEQTEIKPAESAQPEIKEEHMSREYHDDWKSIEPSGKHSVDIMFINVGKADSIVLNIDGGFYMIDTGTSESVPYTLAAMESFGVTELDGVFITHPDRDHVGGYTAIRSEYEVGTVYSSAICGDMYVIEGAAVNDTHVKLEPGEVVELADGVYFEVLGPYEYNSEDDNNNSLVMRLRVNGVSVLFAGDMKEEEEASLLSAGVLTECDVLKVGHHGRKDATSEEFLDAVQPKYAVISTSVKEADNTANRKVLVRLKHCGCEDVYVTEDYDLALVLNISEEGEIKFDNLETSHDGEKIKISAVSKKEQTVVLENNNSYDVDLSGWYLTSDRGGEILRLPDGTTIKSGKTLKISCKGGDGDVIWNESSVWHKSKDDKASIIDCYGNLIDEKYSE